MATTELRKSGRPCDLTDRETRFVLEYLVDYNASRAVRAAGYSSRSDKAVSVMGCKLLKKKHIKAMVGKLRRETVLKLELTREEILLQLFYLATRSGADFVDKNGRLVQNLNDLPERAQQAIDGIEQEIKTFTYEDGTTMQEVKTKFKLVGKATAIDMAMKHKGLFAPDKKEVAIAVLDWNKLLEEPNGEIDAIEQRIIDVESKAIEGKKPSKNGNSKK